MAIWVGEDVQTKNTAQRNAEQYSAVPSSVFAPYCVPSLCTCHRWIRFHQILPEQDISLSPALKIDPSTANVGQRGL